jgi:DNA-binding Xre family transcriptional regulator
VISPESINLAKLPSVDLSDLSDRAFIPSAPGIYFCLSADGEVLYIGRSINISRRWIQHHRQKQLAQIDNVRLAWLEVSDTYLLPSIEKALIEYFNPSLNFSPVAVAKGKRRFSMQATISTPIPDIRVTIRLEPFWTEDLTNDKVADAIGVDTNSISNLRKGTVDRCKLTTLVKLKEFFSQRAGKPLMLEDFLKVEE